MNTSSPTLGITLSNPRRPNRERAQPHSPTPSHTEFVLRSLADEGPLLLAILGRPPVAAGVHVLGNHRPGHRRPEGGGRVRGYHRPGHRRPEGGRVRDCHRPGHRRPEGGGRVGGCHRPGHRRPEGGGGRVRGCHRPGHRRPEGGGRVRGCHRPGHRRPEGGQSGGCRRTEVARINGNVPVSRAHPWYRIMGGSRKGGGSASNIVGKVEASR